MPLAAAHPHVADIQCALGETLAEAGRLGEAEAALRQAVKINGKHPRAHRALGDVLTASGDSAGADAAYAKHIEASVREPRLMQAASSLAANDLQVAERLLRAFLKENPTDVTAIRMLAELASRLGRYADAEKLLARCLELAPGFEAARHNYAVVLSRQHRNEEALAEIDTLLAENPRNPAYLALQGATMARVGEYGRTIEAYEGVLKARPDQAKAWMSYGHALKTVGRTEDGIQAYRKSIALKPSLGEAYWSLANLKTFRFTNDDLAAMRAQLARDDISDDDRIHLDFTLGKALEDAGEYEASFAHYARANGLRHRQLGYRAEETAGEVDRAIGTFTPEFFAARRGAGCQAPDPIFIVGLPRSGSTLLEQISQAIPWSRAPWNCQTWLHSPARCRAGEASIRASLRTFRWSDWPSSAKPISMQRASSARPPGPSSSTKCRRIGCMSVSSS
ncbi:MAG: tetratricopeptide repeat protein [Alphaproteobacteria bacterium]